MLEAVFWGMLHHRCNFSFAIYCVAGMHLLMLNVHRLTAYLSEPASLLIHMRQLNIIDNLIIEHVLTSDVRMVQISSGGERAQAGQLLTLIKQPKMSIYLLDAWIYQMFLRPGRW